MNAQKELMVYWLNMNKGIYYIRGVKDSKTNRQVMASRNRHFGPDTCYWDYKENLPHGTYYVDGENKPSGVSKMKTEKELNIEKYDVHVHSNNGDFDKEIIGRYFYVQNGNIKTAVASLEEFKQYWNNPNYKIHIVTGYKLFKNEQAAFLKEWLCAEDQDNFFMTRPKRQK